MTGFHRDASPDVILLDLNLPGISGIEAIPQFTQAAPKAKIIVLTQSDAKANVVTSITLGASGYLLKSATLEQITDAIRTVMACLLYTSPSPRDQRGSRMPSSA